MFLCIAAAQTGETIIKGLKILAREANEHMAGKHACTNTDEIYMQRPVDGEFKGVSTHFFFFFSICV